MKTILNTPESTNTSKVFCVLHEQETSQKYRSSHQHNIPLSDQLYEMAVEAYQGSQVYKNFRKNFIAIKIDHPRIVDVTSKSVELFEQYCQLKNVVKVKTQGSIIYRIYK